MKNRRLVIMVVFVLVGGLVAGNISYAETAKDFYKGKVIEFIVPYTPGGGTDVYTRLVAQYLPRYTAATVVVRNMPGAGGIVAYNHIYTTKPNGLTIAITDTPTVVLGQLLGQKGVQYDYKKIKWLGRISYDKRVILVANDSPFRTVKDIIAAKEIKVSGTGKTDPGSTTVILVAHALGLGPGRIKPVLGYSSGKELMMAVMQKEVDMTSLTEGTLYGFAKQRLVKALLCIDRERSEYLPQIPTIYEQVDIPEERGWPLNIYHIKLARLKRGVITSPGVPQERVNFLRDALARCLLDKDLLAKATKIERTIKPLSGAEMEKQLKEVAALSKKQIGELKHIIMEKYY